MYDEITFVGRGKVRVRKGRWVNVPGKLSIRGKTKNINLKVRFNGMIKDPWGNTKVGFDAKTTLNRYDYGVKWNKKMAAGNWVVGKMIKIKIRGEANKKK